MKKKRVIIILIIFSAFMSEKCSSPADTSSTATYFKIKIDSVQAPASVFLRDTVKLRVWGIIGANSNYSFSNLESSLSNSKIELTFIGKHMPAYTAEDVIIQFQGDVFPIVPISKGPFEIIINEPDRSALKDTVYVY